MKKYRIHTILLLGLLMTACDFFQPADAPENVARVNEVYLNKNDIQKAIPKDLSKEDSLIFVQNYINRWATRQLLLEGAKLNLPQKTQDEYNAMVNDYRNELYAEAYKDMIIAQKMDTVVQQNELENYFEEHRSNFRLKEDLIKLRYIQLSKDYAESDEIIKQFKRYNEEDQEKIEDDSFKFEAYSLMDSIWVSADLLKERIQALKDEEENFLKENTYLQRSDSLSLYLIYIKDVRLQNEQAPLSYARPTIKQIILNKRKLQFAKEFEKDITKDALENDKFEIFN